MSGRTGVHASPREVWRYTSSDPHVRRAFGAVMGCAVVAFVALLYGFPAWRESRAIEAALTARYEQAARERGHEALVRAVRQATADVEAIETKLAAQAVQTTLVNQLNGITRRHGVRILSSSYEEAKPGDGSPPLFHELTAEGDYAALRRFVSDLRTMPTLTIIREASLTTDGENAARLTARLRMVTYRKASDGR